MFDMSWGEIMVIGGVALIVIGPKDLPKALRTVGQMTSKVRRLAGEFQTQFSDAMREAELEDVKKEMEGLNRDVTAAAATGFNPIQTIRDELRGAVESDPAKATGTGDWTPPPASVGGDPLAAAVDQDASRLAGTGDWSPLQEPPALPDPVSVDPGTLNPDLINPEVQPLVPLPADELSPPATIETKTQQASASFEPVREKQAEAATPRESKV